ncbi:hypothetical protein ACR79P_09740 [Sphingobacterium spiritivorum]|uniref:hypothetical protein n=1 Tax=Sphingobacterium spiritivorum TaxID=258 RepID=UPI003DA5E578
MTLLSLQILFFCLIPIGVFILIRGIQLIRKTFNGKIVLEIPYVQKAGTFAVTKAGNFSVWQKGEIFKRTPVDKFRLHICEKSENQEIKLNPSLLRPQTNDFSTGRMELYRFYAPVGSYSVELNEGNTVSNFESAVTNAIPLPSADLSKYSIQIRESQSLIATIVAIPMILLGIFGTVGGLVLGLLADQILK